ncbi:MAG: lysophospholipid acyltransferase family protein [Myxococcota bacterium]
MWIIINAMQAIGIIAMTFTTGTLGFSLFGFTRDRDLQCSFTRTVWSPGLLAIGGVKLTVEHESPIDWDKPHIYVMNHQSAADIPAAFVGIPVNLRFIAKKILRYVPWLGTYMVMTGMIFVDRGNHRKAITSMRMAAKRIREGCNIIAFPEGTRSRDGEILPFKKGPFMLAIEAGVPIVPCALEGGQHIFPPGLKIRPGPMTLKTGTPIATENLHRKDRDQLIRQVRDEVIRLNLDIGGAGGPAEPYVSEGLPTQKARASA